MKTHSPLSKLTPDSTLSQIISADGQAGQLLASIGLEPAEHKDETLRSVCKQRQWSEVEVLQWIKKHHQRANGNSEEENPKRKPDFGNDVLKWTNYVEKELHATNIQLLNEISDDFPRIHQIHGNQYTWLKDIAWYLNQFEESFRIYSAFEKKKFYPLVRKLNGRKQEILDGTVRELERSIIIIEEDQNQLQRYINTIRKKSHNFENTPLTCSTLRIMYQNFMMLFAKVEEQFSIEREHILPLVNQNINDI